MKKWFVMAKLQIKAAFHSLPKILMGTLLLTLLAVLVGLCGMKLMENDNHTQKMTVAVVYSESENEYIEQAFQYLEQVDTIQQVCTFVKLEYDDALKQLRDGSVTAVIRIPENFIHDIMVGINTPAEVIFLKDGVNNSSKLFQELITAAAVDISTAEAGIYSVDDACRSLGLTRNQLKKAEKDMNQIYLAYVIERGTHFITENIASTGSLSVIQFYVCTGIVMLLLFSGIICVELLKKDNAALSVALKRENLHPGMLGAAKVLGVTVVFFCIGVLIITMTMLATLRFPAVTKVLTGTGFLQLLCDYIALFVLLYGVFSFVYCIYSVASHPVYGVLLLFTFGMLMMFASGCFMPSALLPKAVQFIGSWLPTAWYFRLSGEILSGSVSFISIFANVVYSVIFLGIAALQERWSR